MCMCGLSGLFLFLYLIRIYSWTVYTLELISPKARLYCNQIELPLDMGSIADQDVFMQHMTS